MITLLGYTKWFHRFSILQHALKLRPIVWPCDAIWQHRSDSALAQVMDSCLTAPEGIKPLPELVFTHHQQDPVTFIWGKFHKRYLSHQSVQLAWKFLVKISFKSPRNEWAKVIRSGWKILCSNPKDQLISSWTKWMPFRRQQFEMHFYEWKFLYFDSNFTEVFSFGSNWQ